MAETKKKKLRLYKFAADFNLSSDELIAFLKDKGYNIKSFRSELTDEMLAEIHSHYKKEMEKAEKHYKKLSEFQKMRSETPRDAEVHLETDSQEGDSEKKEIKIIDKEAVVESADKESKVPEEPEEVSVDSDGNNSTETVETVEEETSDAEVSEEVPEPETVEEKLSEEVAEEVPQEDEVEVKEEGEKEKKEEKFVTETEKALKKVKTGLKIVGKVELEDTSKKKRKKKGEPKKKEAEASKVLEEKTDKPAEPSTKDATSKKKKKKRLKAKKKGEGEGGIPSKKKKKGKKIEVDKKEVDKAIKRTLMSMDDSALSERASFRKKKRKEKKEEIEKQEEIRQLEKSKIKVTEFIAVSELANLMGVDVSEVIQKCIELGMMVSINQRLDFETITLVADEFGIEVELEEEYTSDVLEDVEDPEDTLEERPPVVTIMGHVDHGKTSLLDFIRRENVVAGEAGGITQHIGAYQVTLDNGKKITFLDTPGHEAFTAMRARGASITDIVVLVVAADDSVMPQTVEAINHAQAAGVPMIVAINKIDKPNANVEKIKQQLADRNVLIEEWGGKYQSVELSAKTGQNIDELLEKILLEAEVLELKANPNRKARGVIIETKLEKGRGVTSTVLIQKGTLKIGDPFVAGNQHGRVRAMFDERNKKVDKAEPSAPVLIIGFEGAPQAGDMFVVVDSEKEAREIALKRQQLKREQDLRQVRLITLDEIANQINKGGYKELPLVVKGDVDGSVEALSDSLMKLSNESVAVKVIHKGVGAISESDVLLAAASQAIIIGFHVRPHVNARRLAESEKVDIRLYNVIYDAINEVKSALEGLLEPVVSEKLVATLEVRETFKVPKVGTVAGCYVTDGKITRNNKIRLFRDGVVVYEGQLASLKRFKDDVKEVDAGYECGLNIANFNDIKVGDIIESYEMIETRQKLD